MAARASLKELLADHTMPAPPEFIATRRGKTPFHRQVSEFHLTGKKRGRKRLRAESGSVDGFLQVQPEVDMTEKKVQGPLVLTVATRGTEDHIGLLIAQRERGWITPIASFARATKLSCWMKSSFPEVRR